MTHDAMTHDGMTAHPSVVGRTKYVSLLGITPTIALKCKDAKVNVVW
jgi:hypothetical protein